MNRAGFSRILVLGHTGYIGSRLVRAFQAIEPAVPVLGKSIRDLDLTHPDSVGKLQELLDECTAVVICAAIKKQLGDTPEVLAQNLAITLNIGRALAAQLVRRVVFFSSAAVYGEDVQHELISERTPVEPTSYYGIGKFAAERLLLRMAGQHPQTSLLVLRPALVYGPAEPAYFYGPSGFLQKALAGEPITLWGDGAELREFVFIDDLVAAVTRLTFSDLSGTLNIVSGISYTYVDALKQVALLAGREPKVEAKPRTKQKVDHRFDAGAMQQAIPGVVFTSLSDGLAAIRKVYA